MLEECKCISTLGTAMRSSCEFSNTCDTVVEANFGKRYIICLTIGPVFFAAAIYLTLSRIIVHFSPSHTLSRFSPKTISLTFITCDMVALVLQAVGGGFANEASDVAGRDKGTWVMVAGLAFQVASLLAFILVAAEFAWNVRRDQMLTRQLEKGTGAGSVTRIGGGFGSRTSNQFRLFLAGELRPAVRSLLILPFLLLKAQNTNIFFCNRHGFSNSSHPHALHLSGC